MNFDGKRKGSRGAPDEPEGGPPTEDSDSSLWCYITRDVEPLVKNVAAPSSESARPPLQSPRPAKRGSPPHHLLTSDLPQGTEVDRRTAQKLRRGEYPIDRVLDLHGLTQEAARTRLLESVVALYHRGGRCLLVVTGKGRGPGVGVLRQRVPEWLAAPELKGLVLRTEEACLIHGGSGARYVLLRRNKQRSRPSDINQE